LRRASVGSAAIDVLPERRPRQRPSRGLRLSSAAGRPISSPVNGVAAPPWEELAYLAALGAPQI